MSATSGSARSATSTLARQGTMRAVSSLMHASAQAGSSRFGRFRDRLCAAKSTSLLFLVATLPRSPVVLHRCHGALALFLGEVAKAIENPSGA